MLLLIRNKLKKIKLVCALYKRFRTSLVQIQMPVIARRWKKLATTIYNKKNIKVAFLMYELPFWKNEALFQVLLNHERFIPALWITDNPQLKNAEIQASNKEVCVNYAEHHHFLYYRDLSLQQLREQFGPDYIFVVHPYDDHIPFKVSELVKELPCFIPYGYSNLASPRVYRNLKLQLFHRFYLESDYIQSEARKYMLNNALNTKVTGLPMADLLLSQSTRRTIEDKRKNIIWAPHWSIRNQTNNILDVSTFLEVAECMLQLADKYVESIRFIFKPHPLLKRTLYIDHDWGKERTDKYYRTWEEGVNTRLEEGEYAKLFVNSDAMIHDCGSFIQEYLLMDKPCLYLVRSDARKSFNKSTMTALGCYQKGSDIQDIEMFINSVLKGEDPLSSRRRHFINSYLLPSGKSPVQNIISDLLNPY